MTVFHNLCRDYHEITEQENVFAHRNQALCFAVLPNSPLAESTLTRKETRGTKGIGSGIARVVLLVMHTSSPPVRDRDVV